MPAEIAVTKAYKNSRPAGSGEISIRLYRSAAFAAASVEFFEILQSGSYAAMSLMTCKAGKELCSSGTAVADALTATVKTASILRAVILMRRTAFLGFMPPHPVRAHLMWVSIARVCSSRLTFVTTGEGQRARYLSRARLGDSRS